MLLLLWQQMIFIRADLRQECVTVKLLQDLCDKESLAPRALHHLLVNPKQQNYKHTNILSLHAQRTEESAEVVHRVHQCVDYMCS